MPQAGSPPSFGAPDARGDRRRFLQRRQARVMQRFARVDVAEAGDDALIEQGDLERDLLAAGRRARARRRRTPATAAPVPSRSATDSRASIAGVGEIHEAKAPRIVEEHASGPTTSRTRRDRADRPRAIDRRSAPTWNQPDMPRCMISVSPDDSSTIRYLPRRDTASTVLPRSRSTNRVGKRDAQVRAVDDDAAEARAVHRRLEHQPDGFNFRKFGHATLQF